MLIKGRTFTAWLNGRVEIGILPAMDLPGPRQIAIHVDTPDSRGNSYGNSFIIDDQILEAETLGRRA